MKVEEIEALRALALDVNSRVAGRHQETGMEAFMPEKLPGDTILRLLAEREALLAAVRSERERAKARVEAGIEAECECSVCERLKAALTLAESYPRPNTLSTPPSSPERNL